MTTHGPVMPIWTCGGCDLPWPCPTRRRELRAEYAGAPVSLALYLGAYLVQATEDMPGRPPAHCTAASSDGPGKQDRMSVMTERHEYASQS